MKKFKRTRLLPPHVYKSKSGNYSVKIKMFSRHFRIGSNYQRVCDASDVARNALLYCKVNSVGIISLSDGVSESGTCKTYEKKSSVTSRDEKIWDILNKFVHVENTKWILSKRLKNESEFGKSGMRVEEEFRLMSQMMTAYKSDLEKLSHVVTKMHNLASQVRSLSLSLSLSLCLSIRECTRIFEIPSNHFSQYMRIEN